MASAAAVVSVTDTFGSAYIGAMVMMILYGITCLQTYLYFFYYPKDSAPTKLLVSFLWMVDTFHVALGKYCTSRMMTFRLTVLSEVSHAMYHYLVTNYNNLAALGTEVWSLCLSLGINVVMAFVVQIFFMHKIHGLSGNNWWITVPTSVTILAHFGFGMETMAGFFVKKEFRHLSQLNYIAALPFAVTAVLSDIVITIALCFLLQNRKTTFRSTNTLLNYLIIYAINRCLLTSIMAVIEIIVFISLPGTFWFFAVDFIIGKCYANSLLATLNSRQALRGKGPDTESGPVLSTLGGLTPTALEIAGVTPSMLPRSRMPTQTGRMSLSFDDTSRSAETKSIELKELKTPADDVLPQVSVVSRSDGCSSFTFEQRDAYRS